jgi:exodeoxyribonuclease V alpha subunit
MERITGVVSRIHKGANDQWCAGVIAVEPDGVPTSFSADYLLSEGDYVIAEGEYTVTNYGRQFKISMPVVDEHLSVKGLLHLLSRRGSPLKKKEAEHLIGRFGAGLGDAVATNPEAVATCLTAVNTNAAPVVGELARWFANLRAHMTVAWLVALGCNASQAAAIVERHKDATVSIVSRDPWLLAVIVGGIGFKTADKIAVRLKANPLSPTRARAAFLHAIHDTSRQTGDTILPATIIEEKAVELLGDMPSEILSASIRECLEGGDVEWFKDEFGSAYYSLKNDRECESFIRDRVHELANAPWDNQIDAASFAEGDPTATPPRGALNLVQQEALRKAFHTKCVIITGGAGTGKTFTVSRIVEAAESGNLDVILCAPTGKAAKRMETMVGREATTIHKLLGYTGVGFSVTLVPADMIIVDEASMIDSILMGAFLDRLSPNCAVVLVGDPNQLPPVGPGAPFADLIHHKVAPTIHLTTTVRQAGVLAECAASVLRGNVPQTQPPPHPDMPTPWRIANIQTPEAVASNLVKLFTELIPARGYNPLTDCMILVPQKTTPCGVEAINRAIQAARANLQPDQVAGFYPGDRVIMTRNDRNTGIMNGETGIVEWIDTDPAAPPTVAPPFIPGRSIPKKELQIRFDDGTVVRGDETWPPVQLAYAITIHKSQGSEWPIVLTVIHPVHTYMHSLPLIYTAVTRARVSCWIIGSHAAALRAAQRRLNQTRNTWLRRLGPIIEDVPF